MGCKACYHDLEDKDTSLSAYESEVQPTWCSGCGNFGIWMALKRALVEMNLSPDEVLICNDIGCNGNMSDKIDGYRLHSLHGRVLPLAEGAKLANRDLVVIAMAGDGATYSEGINHFINSLRNNFSISFFVHDNGNYGLTTGQASATTPQGAERTANPYGPTADTLSPIQLAMSLNPSYVAQGFSGEIKELTKLFKSAIKHQQEERGFAFTNILQACPTYNKETTHDWYINRKQTTKEIEGYDKKDPTSALTHATNIQKKVVTGILYENFDNPDYYARYKRQDRNGILKSQLWEEVERRDIGPELDSFR
jgi:2-oxoglutarate ferredoxin oxidoreductase subunit beta